jgi:hypothetical protein
VWGTMSRVVIRKQWRYSWHRTFGYPTNIIKRGCHHEST